MLHESCTSPGAMSREYVPCNLCGSWEHALWAFVDDVQIVRCVKCGLIFTNPRLPIALIQQNYEESYSASHEDPVLLAQRRRMYALERRELIRFIKKRQAQGLFPIAPAGEKWGRFLDVGCGTGEFIAGLQDIFDVYGTDISRHYISCARQQYALSQLFVGELAEIGFPENFFDVVQMRGVLQHLPDPSGAVCEAYRITRPGGLLIISATPNIASPAARVFKTHFRLLAPDQMLYNFSPRTLRLLLQKAGFDILCFKFPYLHTPYFRWTDIPDFVFKALKLYWQRLRRQEDISLRSPPFFRSMMTCYAGKPMD